MHHDQPFMRSHIVGRRAVVTQVVDSAGGQIRIGTGEFWSARAYDAAETIPVGAAVEVMVVDGLTALVSPSPQPSLQSPISTSSEKE
jgi:membrane protein implicated in regulation of membrane protease activity